MVVPLICMWRDPHGSFILVSSSERDFSRDGFESLWVGNVDFESVLMYFLLVSWGWVVYLICMSRDPQGPSMLVVSGEEDLQGFWAGGGFGVNASDGQCGFWECFRCVVLALWGWQSSMVCMSMDPHGSVILVLSGERNSQGFWVDLGRLHWNCNIDFFRAVLTSGCLLGVFGLNSMQVGRRSTVWWRNWRSWPHVWHMFFLCRMTVEALRRSCVFWVITLVNPKSNLTLPKFCISAENFSNLCLKRRIHLNLEALDGYF